MKDYFSGNDVERYAYCPLNYLLYLKGVDAKSEKGEKYHKNFFEKVTQSLLIQKRINFLNNFFYFLALLALVVILIFFYYTLVGTISYLFLLLVSLVSVYTAFWFYLLSNFFDYSIFKNSDPTILYLSVFSLIILFLAFVLLKLKGDIIPILILTADFLLLIDSIAYYRLLKDIRIVDKIPPEEKRIKYIDRDNSELLRSEKWKLQGRPDLVAEIDDDIVPIEIKSSSMPKIKPFSHIMQLTAYAILVEEKYGKRVYYGILKYPQGNLRIEIDENMRETLRNLLLKMEEVRGTMEAHRNHNNKGKCEGCYRKNYCPESLAGNSSSLPSHADR